MASLVLTLIGDDRPGLVSAVSGRVESHGGSWQRSRLARLAGKFAGIAEVTVPDEEVEGLRTDLAALAAEGLEVTTTRTDTLPSAPTAWTLHLVGQDRPGIVAEISAALAQHDIGIDELESDLHEAPMAGGLLFEATARLAVADGADVEAVRADLERLADELMVDLDLDT